MDMDKMHRTVLPDEIETPRGPGDDRIQTLTTTYVLEVLHRRIEARDVSTHGNLNQDVNRGFGAESGHGGTAYMVYSNQRSFEHLAQADGLEIEARRPCRVVIDNLDAACVNHDDAM